eukprot:SAG31_NODE_4476_length_3202_cov_3.425717_4_plen_192_part_00
MCIASRIIDQLFYRLVVSNTSLWWLYLQGQTANVGFEMDSQALMLVNATGDRVLYSGEHTLVFKKGDGAICNVTLTVESNAIAAISKPEERTDQPQGGTFRPSWMDTSLPPRARALALIKSMNISEKVALTHGYPTANFTGETLVSSPLMASLQLRTDYMGPCLDCRLQAWLHQTSASVSQPSRLVTGGKV